MSLQGLELLVTVLLARNRQPPPTVAAGVPHAELAAELITLPSGLLAMVCEAIVKRKVRLGAASLLASVRACMVCVRACVRVCVRACGSAACAIGEGRRGPGRVRSARESRVGARASTGSPSRMHSSGNTHGAYPRTVLLVLTYASGFRCRAVSDAERLARL